VWSTLILASGEGSRDALIAEIDPDNKASQRVAERLGFERGELLKECYRCLGGENREERSAASVLASSNRRTLEWI
jgi:RimJ/RimL family protein N-acetyltransferase